MNEPRILLALPRYRGGNHFPFLGIATLASALRRNGVEVAVFDEDLAAYVESMGDDSVQNVLSRVIQRFRPTVVGVHINTPNYRAALGLSRRIKALTDVPVIAGGPHASAAAQVILERHPEIDFVLMGEADETLPQFVRAVHGQGSLETVPGLFRREQGHVTQNPPAGLLAPWVFPLPDRRVFLEPPDPILRKHARAHYQRSFAAAIPGFSGREVAGAYTSRGCAAACPFCSPSAFWADPATGRPVRRVRPVDHLVRELRWIRELGYGAVYFDEPAFPFTAPWDWLEPFLGAMRDLDLVWGGPARLGELDPKSLPALARGGLRYVYVGLETPHPDLLRRIGKASDPDEALNLIAACEAHGVQCDLSLFFGGPGETDATIDFTIEWSLRNLPHGNAFFSTAAIWPATPWAQEFGLTPECWEPDFDRSLVERRGVVWYPEDLVEIDRFFSNSTGTYHPAFLTVDRALRIKERIISSGFRERFTKYARKVSPEHTA